MPGPTGKALTERIANAVARDRLDKKWHVETDSTPSNAPPNERTDVFINATVQDDAGKKLIKFSLAKNNRGHKLVEAKFFAHHINGHVVIINDKKCEPLPGGTRTSAMDQPDGTISHGDRFSIDRIQYELREMSTIPGHEKEKGIYSVILMGPFWENMGGGALPAPYHGVRLKRDAHGAWEFHGPQNLAAVGTQLAAILNQGQTRYTAALETAAKHIK